MPRVFLVSRPKKIDTQLLPRGPRASLWIMTWQLTIFVPFGLFVVVVTKVWRVYYKIVKLIKRYNLAGKSSL